MAESEYTPTLRELIACFASAQFVFADESAFTSYEGAEAAALRAIERVRAEAMQRAVAEFEDIYFGSVETRTWVAAKVRERLGLPPRAGAGGTR